MHVATHDFNLDEDNLFEINDESLHPIVSSREDEEEDLEPQRVYSVIRITRPFRTRWDLVMMLLAIYTCFSVPFFLSFYSEQTGTLFLINTSVDVVFLLDLCLNFFTTYIEEDGEEVRDLKRIREHYIHGNFPVDLVASMPLDNFLLMFADLPAKYRWIQLTDLLKMLRIMRLGRIIRFTRVKGDLKALMKLLQLTLYLLVWVHLTGCVWWLVVTQDDEDWIPVPDFLTGETDVYDSDIWRQYFTAAYHGIWLLTGGEVGPRNSLQSFLASFLIIVGALITAVLFGEMAVLLSNMNKKQTEFQKILDSALTTMKNMNLPSELTNEILDYITSTQNSLSVQEEYETFQKFISPSLQQEVSACIYNPIISRNSVFSGNEQLQKALTLKLKNVFTAPETVIITEGDSADAMYFLVRGEVSVTANDRNKEPQFLTYLVPGAHFGEIGVVYNYPRTATVVGKEYCTIAELSSEDYRTLTSAYPHLAQKFRSCTEIYKDDWKQFLIESLSQAGYFELLHPPDLNELVYYMEQVRLDTGEYLYRPGDPATRLYIVADGLLEQSITLTDQYLHELKKRKGPKHFPVMEDSPSNSQRRNVNMKNYKKHRLDILSFNELKPKAELLPLVGENGIEGSVLIDDDEAENLNTVGKYPQEVILNAVMKGGLLGANNVLSKGVYQTQCKAAEPSLVYSLKYTELERLSKDFPEFKNNLNQIERKLKHSDIAVDYKISEGTDHVLDKLKSIVVATLLHCRETKRKNGNQIGGLVAKVRAVNYCEQAGNLELKKQVLSDEIPPEYVNTDGTLNTDILPSTNNALPKSHPILKKFNLLFDSVHHPEGTLFHMHAQVEKHIAAQAQEINLFEEEIGQLREGVTRLLRGGRIPAQPFKRGTSPPQRERTSPPQELLPPQREDPAVMTFEESVEPKEGTAQKKAPVVPKIDMKEVHEIRRKQREERKARESPERKEQSPQAKQTGSNLLDLIKKE